MFRYGKVARGKLSSLYSTASSSDIIYDLLLTTIVGGLASALSYFFNIIAANKLPEHSFSIFSGVLGLIYLVQIPALTLQTFFTKLVAQKEEELSKREFRFLIEKLMVSSLVLSILFFVVAPFVGTAMDIPYVYLYLLSVIVFASLFTPVIRGVLLGLSMINLFNIFVLVEAVLKLLILLVAINFSTDAAWPILAFGVPTLMVGVTMAVIIRRKVSDLEISKRKSRRFLKKANWSYMFVTFATFFLYNAVFSLDVILVNSANRASYAALALIGKIVFFAAIMATSVLFSHMANAETTRKRRLILFLGGMLNAGVSLSILYILIVFKDAVHSVMFGMNYLEIVPYIVPIGVGVAIYSFAYLFINYLLVLDSKGQVYLLILPVLMQIVLYLNNNNTLNDAVFNQVVTYATIAILVLLYWAFWTRKYEEVT